MCLEALEARELLRDSLEPDETMCNSNLTKRHLTASDLESWAQ